MSSHFFTAEDDVENVKPSLVEPGMKYFINQTLKQCHHVRVHFENTMLNFGLFIALICITASILIYKYKGKLSPAEKAERNRQKEEYILSKIQRFEEDKKRANQELITGLPHWENDYYAIEKTKVVY